VNIDLIEQHGFKLLDLIEETSRVYIWKAIQTTLDRSVFLVILKEEASSDPLEIKYFLQIAQQFAKLKSESLAAVFDIVSENNIHYAIMEHVDGETLDALLKQRGPFDFKHSIQVALSITGCLKQLWNNSRIIHRNIKGSTIRYDSRGIAKITDFSLAVIASPEFNPSVIDKGHVLGAPSFLSPEQSRADETIVLQSDMYAMGALLYYISTGRAPFSELTAPDILRAHLTAQLPPPHLVNPELPVIFSKLLHKLMMKDPKYRYQNWEEIQHDLHCILGGKEPVCARPNLEKPSTIKTDFSANTQDQEQALSFKIKTKKRNQYLSSMQDKHVSHHHEVDKKSQQFNIQLICWGLLTLWLVALFWFRAVIQVEPQSSETQPPPRTPDNAAINTPDAQTKTWLSTMPPDVTIDTLNPSAPDGKPAQKIPEDLLENLAAALARNAPDIAITTLAGDNRDFDRKDTMLSLLKSVPTADQLVAQHLLENAGRPLVMNFKGKPRKVIPQRVTGNIVQLEANGKSIDLNISNLSIDQKLNWMDPPVNAAEHIATVLLLLQNGNPSKAAQHTDKCGVLAEITARAIELRER